MDWNDIKLLIMIERAGSFAGAAAGLGINPATVSRRIADLEHSAGTRLFRRTPVGASPTTACQRLLRQALKVEDDVNDFEILLKSFSKYCPRHVSIQASDGVITYLLSPLIARQRWGPLGIAAASMSIELPPIRTVPLGKKEDVDIRLLWSPPERIPDTLPTDHIRKVANIKFAPFFAKSYVSPGQSPSLERFEALADHSLLTLSQYDWFKTNGSFENWHELIRGARKEVTSVADSAILGLMTVNGGGISLLPTYSVMFSDSLRPVDIAAPGMHADLWLVAGEEDLKDPVVRECYNTFGKVFAAFKWGN
jgi:DNA-binding transcriptional LysR family regulator